MVLNEKIEVRESQYHGGFGLYAIGTIAKGEWVWRETQQERVPARDKAYIESLPLQYRRIWLHFAYDTGDNQLESLPEFDELPMEQWHTVRTRDTAMYMNHACEPTSWFVHDKMSLDEHCDLMVATRDINVGEEITFDYGTSYGHDYFDGFECSCGAQTCRRKVTKEDWKRPELQLKYAGHFLHHIAVKVARYNQQDKWNFNVDKVNKHITNGIAIPAGSIVMRLPPNKIVTRDEIKDMSRVVQVTDTLFSHNLSEEDSDNFIIDGVNNESNCKVVAVHSEDYTIDIIAIRDINVGEVLSVKGKSDVSKRL